MRVLAPASLILLVGSWVCAADLTWHPATAVDLGKAVHPPYMLRHEAKLQVAPDAAIAVFFLERHRRAGDISVPDDQFVALDILTGKELTRRPGIFGLFELRAIAPGGADLLVATPCPGFGCDELSLWSLASTSRRAIDGRGADSTAFSPDGMHLAVQDLEASDESAPDAGPAPTSAERQTLRILDLRDGQEHVFVIPREQQETDRAFVRYAWSADGGSLLVAFPFTEARRGESVSPGVGLSEESWQTPGSTLYRLDLASGVWKRLGALPSTFAGFALDGRIAVWRSPQKRAFALVSPGLLEPDQANAEWWKRYAAHAGFEEILPESSTARCFVEWLFLGEHRSYALIWREVAPGRGLPELWERGGISPKPNP
jgi:hypothetical protein